jgi:hypothetical protein
MSVAETRSRTVAPGFVVGTWKGGLPWPATVAGVSNAKARIAPFGRRRLDPDPAFDLDQPASDPREPEPAPDFEFDLDQSILNLAEARDAISREQRRTIFDWWVLDASTSIKPLEGRKRANRKTALVVRRRAARHPAISASAAAG